jgi:hypothetical protein
MRPGNSLTYHIVASKFKADELSAIESAAGAWRAGAGEIVRGADWQFVRGSDWASGTLSIADNDSGVSKEDDTWFNNQGVAANASVAVFNHFAAWPGCGLDGTDFLFRDSLSWKTDLPAAIDNSTSDMSLGQSAIGAFGNMIGFDNVDTDICAMNSLYPNGGDISASYRISEIDYVGLAQSYPDSSTGKNLMLSKFRWTGGGFAEEGWQGTDVDVNRGDTLTNSLVPEDITVILTGTTGTLSGVRIRWYLRPVAGTCGGAGSIGIGTSSGSVGVNTPYATGLTSYVIPTGTPIGDYNVCALIDPDDAFSETSELDNNVAGERVYHVH